MKPKANSLPATFIFMALFLSSVPSVWANVLGNSGFERSIGDTTIGNWDASNGAARVDSTTVPTDVECTGASFGVPPEGSFALEIEDNTEYTFQQHTTAKAGDYVVFSGMAQSSVTGAASGGQLCIEFHHRSVGETFTRFSQTCSAPINTGNFR